MSTEIYYFSGTGNSLHAAKELQNRIPEANLISMVSLINKDGVETASETIGFVFPIHFVTAPIFVRDIGRYFHPEASVDAIAGQK